MSPRPPKKPIELGYSFVPLPQWIEAKCEAREITDEVERFHRALYRRANHTKLARRTECVEITPEMLAKVLRTSTDAVRKMAQRQKQFGHLDYRRRGSPMTGYVFVFTLFPDGPRPVPEESRKNADNESRKELPATSSVERDRDEPHAEPVPITEEASGDVESRKDAGESRKEVPAKPLRQRDSAASPPTRVPNAQSSPENLVYKGRTTNELEETSARANGSSAAPSERAGDDRDDRVRAQERHRQETGRAGSAREAMERAQATQPELDAMPRREKPESSP